MVLIFVQLATLTAGATAETNPNSFFSTSGSDSEVAARGSFSLSVGSRPTAPTGCWMEWTTTN